MEKIHATPDLMAYFGSARLVPTGCLTASVSNLRQTKKYCIQLMQNIMKCAILTFQTPILLSLSGKVQSIQEKKVSFEKSCQKLIWIEYWASLHIP